jgi:hypothetical protein
MAVIGRFPRQRRFRGCGIGWLRSDLEKTIFEAIDRLILSRLLADRGRFRVRPTMGIQQEGYEIGASADALVLSAMSEAHGRTKRSQRSMFNDTDVPRPTGVDLERPQSC